MKYQKPELITTEGTQMPVSANFSPPPVETERQK